MSTEKVTSGLLWVSMSVFVFSATALVFNFVEDVRQRGEMQSLLQEQQNVLEERVEAMRSPVTIHSHKAEKDVAKVGETINFIADRTGHRYCEGMVFERFYNGTYDVRQPRPLLSKRDGFVGRRTISIPVRLPVKPGYWCYEPTVLWFCEGKQIPSRAPPACLEVVE